MRQLFPFTQKNVDNILCPTKLAQSTSQYYFVLHRLHKVRPRTTLYYTACTKYVPLLNCTTKLAQSTSQYYFVLHRLHKVRPRTTLYYAACTKHFPVLLCITQLAQSTSQYYFILQSLHKVRPSTTLYSKACTKHFPVLLCTTQLAQSVSQYYFVLHSLHKAHPSTTSYYKACQKHVQVLYTLCYTASTKYVPGPHCTTQLAQSTSQYHFVLHSLHKALPSTTSYYKACTKYVPVLLCTAQLAQSTSQYYSVLQSLHKVRPSTTLFYKACTKYFPAANIWLSQPWCGHFNTIYDVQLGKTLGLCTQPWHQATLTQPSQCDLQPESQQTHRSTHTWTTTLCRTERRNRWLSKRPQPHPSHTGYSFHRQPKPLYTEKHKVSCSGFPPNTSPSQPSWSPLSQHPSCWV